MIRFYLYERVQYHATDFMKKKKDESRWSSPYVFENRFLAFFDENLDVFRLVLENHSNFNYFNGIFCRILKSTMVVA